MRIAQITLALLSSLALVTAAPVDTPPTHSVEHHSTMAAHHLQRAAMLSRSAKPGSQEAKDAEENQRLGEQHYKNAFRVERGKLPALVALPFDPCRYDELDSVLTTVLGQAKASHEEAAKHKPEADHHFARACAVLKDSANLDPKKAAEEGAKDICTAATAMAKYMHYASHANRCEHYALRQKHVYAEMNS